MDKLLKRKKSALTPAHYLANFIDPRYQGKCLTAEAIDRAENYVEENFPQFLSTLMRYRGKSMPFKHMHFKPDVVNTLSPLAWWQNSSGDIKDCMMVPTQLHTAVASSAGIESLFNLWTCAVKN